MTDNTEQPFNPMAVPPAKGGRPSEYTQAKVDIICERIACGQSLRTICADDYMPAMSTVFRWLNEHKEFSEQYARAREAQADALFDEILDIADDGRNDWVEKHNQDGEVVGYRENGEAIRRSVLRVDARKWMAGKLKPKKYGDKIDLNHSGSIATLTEEAIDAKIADLLGKTGTPSAS